MGTISCCKNISLHAVFIGDNFLFLGQTSLEVTQQQQRRHLRDYNDYQYSQNEDVSNTHTHAGRRAPAYLRHKKQNRAWLNPYQANSSSNTLNQLQSRLAHLGLEQRPYFAQTQTFITVQEGMNAFFNCKVENIYNQTVSVLVLRYVGVD